MRKQLKITRGNIMNESFYDEYSWIKEDDYLDISEGGGMAGEDTGP